jgi:hypothetical protein
MKQEHAFSCQVARFLRQSGMLTIDTDVMSALRYLSPTDKRRFLYIKQHTLMGYTKGQPDLVVAYKGGVAFVELKANKGKQSIAQKFIQSQFEKMGLNYMVWNKFSDAVNFVKRVKGL